MTSPLDLTLLASNPWLGAVALLTAMPLLRRQWHEGTLKKHEARQKKNELDAADSSAHLTIIESDSRLRGEIDRSLDDPDGATADDLVTQLEAVGLDLRDLGLSRRELFNAMRAMLFLPIDLSAETRTRDEEA